MLVSYDIWDTVLRRCCHPDAVKLFSANTLISIYPQIIGDKICDAFDLMRLRQAVERKIGLENQQKGFDDEYSIADVIKRLLAELGCCDAESVGVQTDKLVRLEYEQELRSIYIDPTIRDVIARDGATRRIYVSDFYMGKSYIDEILEAVGAKDLFHCGYVSCDILLNKRSGRLFDHVARVEPSSVRGWTHVGDNPDSDVAVPTGRKIKAVHYQPPREHRKRLQCSRRFESRSAAITELVADCLPEQIGGTTRYAAMLFIGFALFIEEQVRRSQVKEVWFFTREGEFFHELYEVIRKASPWRNELPPGKVMEVSRIATFAPSLRDITADDLMRLWSLYSTQSPRALLTSLNVDVQEFEQELRQSKLGSEEQIRYPWQDKRVIEFLDDKSVREKLRARLAKQRELLVQYCAQRSIAASGDSVMIVDIGWRGTIQDNVATVFPDKRFHGCYLGLNQFLNPQPENVTKVAFGPNANISSEYHDLLECVAPIEMVANSGNGSVIGYAAVEDCVSALRHVNARENAVFLRFSRQLQLQVLQTAEAAVPKLRAESFSAQELRQPAMAAWQLMMKAPDRPFLEAYFGLSHNETFGVGDFIDKAESPSTAALMRLMVSKEGRRQAREMISRIGWRDGYMRWRQNPLDRWLVRFLLKKRH